MKKIIELINAFLEKIGKKELIVLSFEKKNVSFTGFNLKQIDENIDFLNNNLISAYEDWDTLGAKRIRSMLLDMVNIKKKLEKKIKDNESEENLVDK